MSEEENANYRNEVPRLVTEGKIRHTMKYVGKASDEAVEKIRHTMKYVGKASDETVEKIYKNYMVKQMDKTNEVVTNTLVKQILDLMIHLELIKNDDSLEKDLDNNEPFKKDVN